MWQFPRRWAADAENGAPEPVRGAPTRGVERWSFIGSRDVALESRYVGRSVAAYLGTGTPSPVTYVWCGPHWVNTAQ